MGSDVATVRIDDQGDLLLEATLPDGRFGFIVSREGNSGWWAVLRTFMGGSGPLTDEQLATIRQWIAADLRASTPPAAPALSDDERFTMRWGRKLVVRTVDQSESMHAHVLAQKFDVLAERLAGAECHDPSHQTRAPTPASVDEAFMRRWTERLDVNRNEVRRLLEEAGVGVEPAKEQTP